MERAAIPVEALVAVPAASQPRAAVRSGWIASPWFDATLLLGAPLIGLLTMLVATSISRGALFVTAFVFLVGMPHYLSTFTFFLGDDQRAHYLARPLAYVGAPMAILVSVGILRLSGAWEPVVTVIFLWNIWHVAMQSNGVVTLYRHLGGGAPSERGNAMWAIVCAGAAMALFHAHRFAPLQAYASIVHEDALRWIALALFAAALLFVIRLATQLRARPSRIGGAELAALAGGLLLFHPYLWIEDIELATFGMLSGHFVQYLALVWLFQRRKFGARRDGSIAQRALSAVSRAPWMTVLAIAASGVAVFLFTAAANKLGQAQLTIVVLNALALIHFYLDRLIWAMRKPFVREAIGAYLT